MSPEIWFFFTPDGQAEITVLNRESACHIVKLLSHEQRSEWKVRKNRWPEAIWVNDCKELFQAEKTVDSIFAIPTPAPQVIAPQVVIAPQAAAPQMESQNLTRVLDKISEKHEPSVSKKIQADEYTVSMHQEIKEVISSPIVAKEDEAAKNKRRYPRFPVKLRVVLISGTKSFRTFSKNVSRGGLMLEHVVPADLLGKPCRIIIGSIDLKENIEFDARLTGDPTNPRCIAFVEGKDYFIKKLDGWLEALSNSPSQAAS